MHTRTLALAALISLLLTHGVSGQELSKYRAFELGTRLDSVLTLTQLPVKDVTTVHQRPALLQDVEWRPSRWTPGSSIASTDPVDQVRFSFYNDQLFRIVVDYGHERTAGLTDTDIIEAMSATYGTPVLPGLATRAPRQAAKPDDYGAVVARWGDSDHAVVLYRTSSYGDALRLVLTDVPVDGLARKAVARAEQLDAAEGPQREAARQKKEREDSQAAAEKARTANKPVFRP